jgi:hypothetical protein
MGNFNLEDLSMITRDVDLKTKSRERLAPTPGFRIGQVIVSLEDKFQRQGHGTDSAAE